MADELARSRLGSWTVWADDRSLWPVTPVGVAAVDWAIEVHRRFFGDDLLERMLDGAAPHPFVVHGRWPLTSVHAIVELLNRACALTVLPREVSAALAGSSFQGNVNGRVNSDLDVLEVAGLAARLGWAIEYEALLPSGRRPDLRLVREDIDIRVEVTSTGPDREMLAGDALSEFIVSALMMTGSQYGVGISGSASTSEVAVDDLARFLDDVTMAAADSAATGQGRSVSAHGITLSIRPGGSGLGAFDGPPLTGDMWPRLENRLRSKAAQTAGASASWICVQDRSGLFQLTDLAYVGEHEQLRRLVRNVAAALSDSPHVAGVAISTGVRIDAGEENHDTVLDDDGGRGVGSTVLRRRLPGGRCRRTFVVRLHDSGSAGDCAVEWFGQEGDWLDWALAAAAQPSIESILGVER